MRRRRVLCPCHLEGGKQGDRAVALVIVAMAGRCPAIQDLEIAPHSLQRLDRGLLVDTDDNRVLGRRRVEPLGHELGSLLSHQDLRAGPSRSHQDFAN
jgi:hypothetical protein